MHMIGIIKLVNTMFLACSREEQSEIDVTSGLYVLFGSGKNTYSFMITAAALFPFRARDFF